MSRLRDLRLLTPLRGIPCLVVPAEEKEDSIAVCMTEDAKKKVDLSQPELK